MRHVLPPLVSVSILLVMMSTVHAYASSSAYTFGFDASHTYPYKTADVCHSVSLKDYDNCLMGYSAGEEALWKYTPQYLQGWNLQRNGSMTGAEDKCLVYGSPDTLRHDACTNGYNDALASGPLSPYEVGYQQGMKDETKNIDRCHEIIIVPVMKGHSAEWLQGYHNGWADENSEATNDSGAPYGHGCYKYYTK